MKTRKSQLTLAASALAMAVALAGCGGGGTALNSGSNVAGSSASAASFAETWTNQHAAIRSAISGAQGALDALKNDASNMDLDAAQAGVTAITLVIDAGTYLSEAEKTSYRAMQTALRSALMVRREGVMAQREVDRLTGALAGANGDNKELQDQLTAAQNKVTMLETDLKTATGKVTMLETDLDTATGKVTMLETDLKTATGKVTMLETDLKTATGDNKELQDQLTAAQNKVTMLETDLDTATDKVTMLETDLDTATDKVTMLETDLDTATDKVTMLETDLDTATDKVTMLETDLDTATDKVTMLETDLDTATDRIKELEGQLDTARQGPQRMAIQKAITALNAALAKVDAGATDAEVKAADDALATARSAIASANFLPSEETGARTGDVNTIAGRLTSAKMARTTSTAAATKEAAIAEEGAQATNEDASLGGTARTDADGTTTAADTSDDVYSLTITRPRSGTKIEIEDPSMAAEDDPKFVQAMDLGGGSTMHTRTLAADEDGDVVQEVVVVTTDIAAPLATKFASVYPLDVMKDDGEAPGAGETADSFDIPDNASPSEGELESLMRVMASAFTANTAATLTFLPAADDADPDTSGNQPRSAYETSGTYDGASGRYKCTGTVDCTVALDADGDITAMVGGWVFTPGSGVTVDVPDSDFLRYGFWLQRTTDDEDVLEYDEVETFAGSSVDASSDITAVTGTASYDGGATGVYVHSVNNPDGSRNRATSGHFTADAFLTANFAQLNDANSVGTIAPNRLNTIKGTIDEFVLSGGEANNWSVTLDGSITAATGTASGTAKGGVGDGSFNATFHGSVTAGTDGVVPKPGSVVGEFNAGFTNGSVAGAFGARLGD